MVDHLQFDLYLCGNFTFQLRNRITKLSSITPVFGILIQIRIIKLYRNLIFGNHDARAVHKHPVMSGRNGKGGSGGGSLSKIFE